MMLRAEGLEFRVEGSEFLEGGRFRGAVAASSAAGGGDAIPTPDLR